MSEFFIQGSGGGGSGIITIDGNTGSVTGSTVSIVGTGSISTSGSGTTLTITSSGGSGVTIDGDTGSITGSTLTIYADNAAQNSGSSVEFVNSGTISTLNVTDAFNNTIIGKLAGNAALDSAFSNTGLGYSALAAISGMGGSENVAIGYEALSATSQPFECCSIGAFSMSGIGTGQRNNALGWSSLRSLTNSASYNNAIGFQSLFALSTGQYNIALGHNSGQNYTGAESSNILIGNSGVLGESNAIRIGFQGTSDQEQNICYIAGINGATPVTGNTPQVVLCDSQGNLTSIASSTSSYVLTSNGTATPSFQVLPSGATLIGYTNSSGNFNTALGFDSFASITGQYNVSVGALNGQSATVGGSYNCCLGVNCMASSSSGNFNIAIGYGTLFTQTAGHNNTAVGGQALENVNGGINLTCIGFNAGTSYTSTESNNICIGSGVLGTAAESNAIHIGDNGTSTTCFIGGIAGVTVSNLNVVTISTATGQLGSQPYLAPISTIDGDTGTTTGNTITFNANSNSGSSVKFAASGGTVDLLVTDTNLNTLIGSSAGNGTISGTANSGLGFFALNALTSGISNVAVGYGALDAITSGGSNIGIGHLAGSGYTSSESGNICIGPVGTAGESNTTRLGMSSTTSCFVSGISGVTVTGAAVLCSTSGQLGTVVSSEKYKENIMDLNLGEGIDFLRPVSFNYKSDKSQGISFGLIAEEVEKVFPSLVIYGRDGLPESIKYHELPAVLIHEIQKLRMEIKYLKNRIL